MSRHLAHLLSKTNRQIIGAEFKNPSNGLGKIKGISFSRRINSVTTIKSDLNYHLPPRIPKSRHDPLT